MARTALVTGAGVRVGRAIARGLAEDGFQLAIHYNRSGAAAEDLAREIRGAGGTAEPFQADLSDPSAARNLIRDVDARFGPRLDVLVNSASIYRPETVREGSDEAWEQILGINLRAPFQLVREAATLLRAANGAVVNIVDLSAFQAWKRFGIHAVSKAALLKMCWPDRQG